ncbi:hypothetical protein KNCP2_03860 [Candidatus Rickettsia kedanie]|uniref:Uncharacterized protein n=1 Tax=Candidatus Rickettsia kedanie TaxID=3115352 RepID=A0ABP9TUZ4_9RICK
MENQEETLTFELIIDEEKAKRLKAQNARKDIKLILITFAIILTSFLTFCYFLFLNYIEKSSRV